MPDFGGGIGSPRPPILGESEENRRETACCALLSYILFLALTPPELGAGGPSSRWQHNAEFAGMYVVNAAVDGDVARNPGMRLDALDLLANVVF
jgi:hypothetical protein